MKQLPGYYAILPPKIRYNRNLSPNAKLLWAELSALQTHNCEVFASNEYLCKLMNLKQRQMQYLLKELKDNNLITIKHTRTSRIIKVNNKDYGLKDKSSKLSMADYFDELIESYRKGMLDL